MMTNARSILVLCLALHASSCLALRSEPWTRFREGAATMAITSGLSEHDVDVAVEGESGTLDGIDASRSEELRGEYVIGVRGESFVTDSWSVGGGLEWWRHKSTAIDFGQIGTHFQPFGYLRYLLDTRYFFPALGANRLARVRPFAGAELFHVADLDARVDVTYLADPSVVERVDFEGHGFYGYALRTGLAFLVADDTLVEVGGRWIQNFSASDDELLVHPPGGAPSRIETDVDPEGWSVYLALTYSF